MPTDPYRTLGLPADASLDDIKRAYRRLAKAHHPDAAGDAATPRFLAIQAAYEQLIASRGSGRARAARAGSPRPAWQADPARTRATWEQTRRRAGRPATPPGGEPAAAGASHASPGTGTGPGPGPGTAPGAGERPRSGRGHRRKATPGSTTYDEAREPIDPTWHGASWYGVTSGEYWTINPKEYADPRKHGPEYLARARRARPALGGEAQEGAPAAPASIADARDPEAPPASAPPARPAAAPPAPPDPAPVTEPAPTPADVGWIGRLARRFGRSG